MSGTHGVLQPNQPGYFYITLEESYVTLFKISAEKWLKQHAKEENAQADAQAREAHAVAKAYITDVLVKLSNDLFHKTGSEKNLWVFLSFPQLEARLHGACKMRTLKDSMKEMIDDQYVFKRKNSDPRYKALEYRLNLSKYRNELTALPKKSEQDIRANLHDEIIESANLHDDSADLHDDSAKLHPIHNKDITNTYHDSVAALADDKHDGIPVANETTRNELQSITSSKKPSRSKKSDEPDISPAAQVVIERWQSLRKKPVPQTKALIQAAETLAPCDPSAEDLKSIEGFCYITNSEWFKEKGVRLTDVANYYERWQAYVERQQKKLAPAPTAQPVHNPRRMPTHEEMKAQTIKLNSR